MEDRVHAVDHQVERREEVPAPVRGQELRPELRELRERRDAGRAPDVREPVGAEREAVAARDADRAGDVLDVDARRLVRRLGDDELLHHGFFRCFEFVQRYRASCPAEREVVRVGGGIAGVRFVESSTDCVIGAFAPPACSKTILTGPTPYTHQTVRTPLPYGSPSAPACVMSDRTFAAITGSGTPAR